MKKTIYRILLLLTLSIAITSCVDDEYQTYWLDSYLDFNAATRTDNYGNFGVPTINFQQGNLANVNTSRDNVNRIELTDTWLEIEKQFRPGEILDISITVNNVGTFICPRYYFQGYSNRFVIDDSTAPGYFDFMSRAFFEMERTGWMPLSIYGASNTRNDNINIYFKNNLNVLLENRW